MIAQPIAVLGRVREQGLARSDRAQHVVGRPTVMGMPGGQLEGDRQALGIGDGVDLGRQAARERPMQTARKSPTPAGPAGALPPFLRWLRAGGRGSRTCPPTVPNLRKPLTQLRISDPIHPDAPNGQSGYNTWCRGHGARGCRPRENRSGAASRCRSGPDDHRPAQPRAACSAKVAR